MGEYSSSVVMTFDGGSPIYVGTNPLERAAFWSEVVHEEVRKPWWKRRKWRIMDATENLLLHMNAMKQGQRDE